MRSTLCLTLLLLTAPSALAAPFKPRADGMVPANPEAEGTGDELDWYGGPILLSDALSFGLAMFALKGEDNLALLAVSAGTWVGGPALVHRLNGHLGRSAISVSMRVLVPLAGALAGSALGESRAGCGFFGCGFEYGMQGFLLGALTSIIADQVLAIERRPRATPDTPAGPRVTVIPTFQVAAGSFGAGLRIGY